jgi:TonB family protein
MPRQPFASLAASTSGKRRAAIFPFSVLLHAAGGGALLVLSAVAPAELPPVVGRTVITGYVPLTPTVRAAPPVAAPPRVRPAPTRGPAPSAPAIALPAILNEAPLTDAPVDDPPALCLFDCDPVGVIGASEIGPGSEAYGTQEAGEPGLPTGPPRVGGEIREPRRIHYVAPAYPEIARQGRIGALVILDCVLDPRGRIASLQVLRGHPLFDGAAVDAVRQWRYEATRLNGVPIAVQLTVTVRFLPKS